MKTTIAICGAAILAIGAGTIVASSGVSTLEHAMVMSPTSLIAPLTHAQCVEKASGWKHEQAESLPTASAVETVRVIDKECRQLGVVVVP
jgi:hypothetical protein